MIVIIILFNACTLFVNYNAYFQLFYDLHVISMNISLIGLTCNIFIIVIAA